MSLTHHRRRTIPCHIERDVFHSLRLHAQRTGRPTTDVVAEAVSEYLDRQEGAQCQQFQQAT
jgi:hypothetical protein